jgi:hypothetical protein
MRRYIWTTAVHGTETVTLRNGDQKYLEGTAVGGKAVHSPVPGAECETE